MHVTLALNCSFWSIICLFNCLCGICGLFFFYDFLFLYLLPPLTYLPMNKHCPFSVQYTYISHIPLVIYLVCGRVRRQDSCFPCFSITLHQGQLRVWAS